MPTRFSFETDTAFSGRKTVDGDDVDPAPAGRFGIAAQHQVTGDLIDEAVNAVMKERQVDDATADTFRHLMSSDPTTGIAQAYYQSKAASGLARSHLAAEKKRMTIPYVLTDKQVADLTSYAPEYSLEFRGSALHDHSVSAASRMIDQALVESKVPPGVKFSDVGGSPEHHAKRAAQNVHICQPKVDRKDPARAVQRDMKLRNLAVNSAEAAVRRFATSYLDGDPAIVCDSLAQDCKVQTPVVISVHVYDVPMVDWPTIMESKGARLVEGCMLYSPRVMEEVSGLFPVAGAHFEADPQRDIFRMGFVGSPSWWYEHSWLEYCKYGVDQILYGKKGAYSYKVTERRGDTIFFRILPVSSGIPRNVHQVFRLPDVQMVEVHGYDVGPMAATSRVLRRKTWLWPMPLWRDMMRHGLEMVERNTLSHERLYNHYRTIAPRQTINAHLVAGGYTVPMNELVPLIVHVAMAAAAAVLGSQTVSRQIVGAEMAVRRRGDEYTVTKLVSAFASTVKAAFGVVLFPVTMLGDAISKTASRTIQSQLVDWAPRAVCRPVNAKFLVMDVEGFSSNDFSTDDVDFSREVQEDAPFDHIRAAMADPDLAIVILDKFADCLPTNVIDDLQKQVDKHKAEKNVDKQKLKSGSRVDPSDTSSTLVDSQSRIGVVKQREDAVLEAIVECEMEQKKIQASCFLTFRELCHSRPSVSIIKKRAEEFRNPDFWWVESGVISGGATSTSVLGVAVEDFMHAAVFTPVQNPDSDSFIRPVFSSDYSGSSKGSAVVRSHTVLSDSSYTGWVMTNDSLLIYNGPEIVETMRLALTRGFDYSVKLVQGPPGCGKTTSIVHSFRSDSVVLCPVRKSTEETRGRLIDEFDDDAVDFRNLVRTLDSYLVNYPVNGKMRALTPSRLLADEGFMSHSGKWHAAAALLGVDEVEVFGDRFQIPHVPRAEAPKMHLRIQPDVVQEQWLTYRCPPDAVAAWGHVYGWRVRSTSTVARSLKHVPSHRGLNIPFDCVMMGMYQADKKELKQMYSNCGTKVRIMTVHESEGNTYDHVWLHRFDRRKRSDEFSLYDKQPYVLVAMSRHRQSFTYICPELDDLTSRWIKQAKDVRRVQAASDVETAGEPKEFY